MEPVIRLATKADAEQVQAIYGPVVRDTAVSFEVEPPTVEEMGRRIATTLEHFPWLVCELDGQVQGYAYAGRHRARERHEHHDEGRATILHDDFQRSEFESIVQLGAFRSFT